MKKIRSIFVCLCCMLLSNSALAQIRGVQLSPVGTDIFISVAVSDSCDVILDVYGNVVDMVTYGDEMNHNVQSEYYSDFHSYEAGKLKSYGPLSFTYYSSFHDYEAGKIKSIGDMKFTYYSKFHSYEAAKIKSIAGDRVEYYSDFYGYEAGKIKSIAGVRIAYYSDFYDYEAGKIKSIGSHSYKYHSNFGGNAGALKTGVLNPRCDGIDFVIRARRPRY